MLLYVFIYLFWHFCCCFFLSQKFYFCHNHLFSCWILLREHLTVSNTNWWWEIEDHLMVLSKQVVPEYWKTLFHKSCKKRSIPSSLSALKKVIAISEESILQNFGVLSYENLLWTEHIKYLDNEIAKNIGHMCRAKPFLVENHF